MFERGPWWEGPEVELEISTSGYAAATGGRRITNNGTDNWVHVTGGQIPAAPGPLRLQLTNDTGASQDYRHFYIGLNAFASPAAFSGVHQGEADTLGTGAWPTPVRRTAPTPTSPWAPRAAAGRLAAHRIGDDKRRALVPPAGVLHRV